MIRDRVVYCATTLLGPYGKGSPEVYEIWRDVCDPAWSDSQVREYAKTREWCGGFALHALRLGGATQAHWKDGVGFIGPLGLHVTHTPNPGDIAVKAHPFAHHMVIEAYNNAGDWWDFAGNTAEGAARHHHTSIEGITFYSIGPLLPEGET
jgi:hypothetical protein